MTAIEESNEQFIGAWSLFCRRLPGGTIESLDGVVAVFGNVPPAFFNVCFLTSPASDAADFVRRVAAAVEYAAARGNPWFLALCADWVPPDADRICGGHGLALALPLTGMAADRLAEPRRPLPALEYSRVEDQASCDRIANINADAYGFPQELARHLAATTLWEGRTYPYLGAVEGEPVTCSATVPVDGRLYVGWVATLPAHHRKGYAEAVMRHSLDRAARDLGSARTVLHATEAGRPLYEAMGYRTTTRFGLYAQTPGDETHG